MAQGYYTLEEAAKVLGMSSEKLNKMAQDPRWLKDQKVNAFRDPKVVWHAPTKQWIVVLYKTGSDFAFFSSPDLKRWTHLQDMTVPGCDECPDFFE